MKQFQYFLLLSTIICYSSCKTDIREVPQQALQQNFEIKINRFDVDLFKLASDSNINYQPFAKKYPDFFYLFTRQIINIGDSSNPQLAYILKDFLNDGNIKAMQQEVVKKFPNTDNYNSSLTNVFKGYKYFFPQKKIPKIIYFTSGYNFADIATANTLGIGLEMYLGAEYEPYTLLQIPLYKRKIMRPEYLVSDAIYYWLFTEFENNKNERDLLSLMLYKGKVIYALDKLLPNVNDTIKLGYTSAQLDWCGNNEKEIYTYFIQKKLLFAQIRPESMKYLNEGPFTAGFPRESPGKLGVWLGYQVIKQYMENNPSVTLQQLFENYQAQAILKASKYKPK